MYSCGDLKKGLKLIIDGDPHVIVAFDFTKPGKGQALYKCKLRNMLTGSLFERTYRSGESFEPAQLEERDMQYLYKDESGYVFMDQKTYEQVTITEEVLGDDHYFLIDNMQVKILLFNERGIGVTLPNFVNLRVDPGRPLGQGGHRRRQQQTGHRRRRLYPAGPLLRRGGRPDPDRHPHRRLLYAGQGIRRQAS